MADVMHNPPGPTFPVLVRGIVADGRELVSQYLALVRREIREDVRKTGETALWLVLGGAVAIFGSIMIILTLPPLLHWAMPQLELWAWFGIVGLVLAAIGGGLVFLGLSKAPKIGSNLRTARENAAEALPEPTVTAEDVELTRASLMAKVETLENRITEPVEAANQAVHHAIDEAKETFESVKENLDLPRQVDRHPFGMLLGSVAVGFLAGKTVDGIGGHNGHRNGFGALKSNGHTSGATSMSDTHSRLGLETQPSQFHAEIDKLKRLGIGMLLGLVRDKIATSMPDSMKCQVADVVDDITMKLGGEPLSRPAMKV